MRRDIWSPSTNHLNHLFRSWCGEGRLFLLILEAGQIIQTVSTSETWCSTPGYTKCPSSWPWSASASSWPPPPSSPWSPPSADPAPDSTSTYLSPWLSVTPHGCSGEFIPNTRCPLFSNMRPSEKIMREYLPSASRKIILSGATLLSWLQLCIWITDYGAGSSTLSTPTSCSPPTAGCSVRLCSSSWSLSRLCSRRNQYSSGSLCLDGELPSLSWSHTSHTDLNMKTKTPTAGCRKETVTSSFVFLSLP